MMEFLFYDLKVAVLIAAFYFCYRLLMERDTLHRLNRVVCGDVPRNAVDRTAAGGRPG